MNTDLFNRRLDQLRRQQEQLLVRPNTRESLDNGIVSRYTYPILTADHVPLSWRYDLNPETNPILAERLGINAVFNPGAIKLNGAYCLAVRVEGVDRKSFFAVAQSPGGIDRFRFRDEPIILPELDETEINHYDMRLIWHEDGWIYGVFCVEYKDPDVPDQDTSSAVAKAGIARTRDLVHWQRLPNIETPSPQQRNVVLHPEFVDGCYAFYTRPQDGFIDTGSGSGIGWGLCKDIENPVINQEIIIHPRRYHTVYEVKNGLGPAPIKTDKGWLQLAHGVRNTAAGLRYVLYLFMTDLKRPWEVIHEPGGCFMAPQGPERAGDVSNVLFSCGWIPDEDGKVYIYYASSDTRCHVAVSSVEQLIDYVMNTPPDAGRTAESVRQRLELIRRNAEYTHRMK